MKNNLKVILMFRNKRQKDLAKETGVTEAAVSHYIKGDRIPKYKTMVAIAKALNVKVENIWGM